VEVITEKQVPKTPKPELQPDDDATVSMAATKAASAKAAAEEAAAAEAEALREQEALARRAREEAEKRKRDQQRKRKVPLLIAAGALVLVIILAGLWFFTQRGPTPFPPNQANQANQDTLNHGGGQPAPAPAPSECDSEPFPAITQCEHDPAKLYQVGQARMTAGNAQDGVSLFGVAAKDGYGPAALALAKLYDPASFQQNAAIQQSDPGQAALYYRMAVNDGDQDAVAPRAALYQHLQQAASQGDLQAPNLLNDYWP